MSKSLEKTLEEDFPPPGEVGREGSKDEVGIIFREEVVEVPVRVVRERFVEIEPKIVEREVEVPEIKIVEKIKEVKKIIEQERITRVPKIVQQERIVEVPEIQEVEVVKEKIIVVPQIEEKIVERVVEVPNYVEVEFETIVNVPVKTGVNRRGVALYEVNTVKEYTVPTPKIVYEDIDVEIRLPKFIQVLPGQSKSSDEQNMTVYEGQQRINQAKGGCCGDGRQTPRSVVQTRRESFYA